MKKYHLTPNSDAGDQDVSFGNSADTPIETNFTSFVWWQYDQNISVPLAMDAGPQAGGMATGADVGLQVRAPSAADDYQITSPHLGQVTAAAWTSDFSNATSNITAPPPINHDLTFNLVNVGGVTPGSQAEAGFQRAAALWQSFVGDAVTIRLDVGFSALGPGILGSTGSNAKVVSYSAVRQALAADQTSSDDAAAVASLSAGSSLSFFTNNSAGTRVFDSDGSANNTYLDVSTANLKALGIATDANGQPVDTGAADGNITFSSNFTWDFDPSNGITAGAIDFVGVAFHEIGHALGFFSGVDTVDYYSGSGPGAQLNLNPYAIFSVLDLFRYSGSGVRDLSYGGTTYFSLNSGVTNLALFSTGDYQGDGNQASHWKDGLGIGIMDPTSVPAGQANVITSRDIQALDVIGWNRVSAATPPTVSINDVTILEGNSGTKALTFTVTRIGGSAAFDLTFASSNGTATLADGDYLGISGTLHFGAGVNAQTLTVTINGDTKIESNETFFVNLSGATNGATISDNLGMGTIADDDGSKPLNDFNGDAFSDLLWRHNSGPFTEWQSTGNGFTANVYTNTSVDNSWRSEGSFDFNGDGMADLLWRSTGSGAFTVWNSNGNGFTANSYTNTSVDTSWTVAALADFNGDGKDDLLWRNTNGAFTEWQSTGTGFAPNVYTNTTVDNGWHLVAAADFSGDGKDDLLWRHNSGAFTEWQSTGNGFTPNVYTNTTVDNGWQLAAVADFNGDSKDDLLWRHNSGPFTEWQSTGNSFTQNVVVNTGVGADWTLVTHHYDLV